MTAAQMAEVLRRLREMHARKEREAEVRCEHDGIEWPCPTIHALVPAGTDWHDPA